MQTVTRSLTTRTVTTLSQSARHYALPRSTRPFASLAPSPASVEVARVPDNDPGPRINTKGPQFTDHPITIRRVERLISRGQCAKACHYVLSNSSRQSLSTNPAKLRIVLKALDAFLKNGAEAEARALQRALLDDTWADVSASHGPRYGLMLLCLAKLTRPTPTSRRKGFDWSIRAHRDILRQARPLLQDISADDLARVLDRLSRVRDAGAKLCVALAGEYARIHGNKSLSRRLGIQIARLTSSVLASESEAGFRQSIKPFPGAGALMRGTNDTSMPWAARAMLALQRTSHLEQNLAEAQHARHLRELYEERSKGKGPLEPVTFRLEELVRPDGEDTHAPELSEVQLDLIAEGARMSLLVSSVAQRGSGAKPSKSERARFRKIGERLTAFSRADFERMSEAELNDLISRQEQYMRMVPLFAAKPSTENAAGREEARAPDDGPSDVPARTLEDGDDTCTVAGRVQPAGSPADLSDTCSKGDGPGSVQADVASRDAYSEPAVGSIGVLEPQLRSFAELLDMDPTSEDISINTLGQRLVHKAVEARFGFEGGHVDQAGLNRMADLVGRFAELQATVENDVHHNQNDPSSKVSFDEIVRRLDDASSPTSGETHELDTALERGASTLETITTFLAEVARLGAFNRSHISAALATMSSRGIEPDAQFFTVLITASVRAKDIARAHALYDAMLRSSQSNPRLTPTSVTYASLFKAAELPQPRPHTHPRPNPRHLFLPSPPQEGIRAPRVLFREMMDLHDRITRGMRSHRKGSPGQGLPPISVITRDSARIALRAFLRIGDFPGVLGVLHAFQELHMRPSHTTCNVVFRELTVHIRRDTARAKYVAGPVSSRWSTRFLGTDATKLNDYQLMSRLYDLTFPKGTPRDRRSVPTFDMVQGAQRMGKGSRWEVGPLEKLVDEALFCGMEPKPGLEGLTRDVAREEGEAARRDMVPPPFRPGGADGEVGRVVRAWKAAKLRERRERRRVEENGVGELREGDGQWDF
ncbi:unnamed protein product [Peniophora sp. CBMAI 1063]|nr:unnamed protein product [Peniophora sp. CBMAI 1063]